MILLVGGKIIALQNAGQGDSQVKHNPLQIIVWLCVLITGSGISSKAFGDNAALHAIADFITKDFPIDGMTASAGNDWCLEAETDPNNNWWTFANYDGTIVSHSAQYTARIRLTYYDPSGNSPPNVASLFLAIDTNQPDYYYGSPTIIYPAPGNKHEVNIQTSSTPITFPNSNTPCPKLEDFLNIIFERNITNWIPLVANPACKDTPDPHTNQCVPVGANPSKQTSQTDSNNFLYWNFNGKVHKIIGAVRLLIDYCIDVPANCSTTGGSRKSNNGYLFIGFGGNGGAG